MYFLLLDATLMFSVHVLTLKMCYKKTNITYTMDVLRKENTEDRVIAAGLIQETKQNVFEDSVRWSWNALLSEAVLNPCFILTKAHCSGESFSFTLSAPPSFLSPTHGL